VNDKAPRVETVLQFVEPHRDPLGVRYDFEGIVGIQNPAVDISDAYEPKVLNELAKSFDDLVCKLLRPNDRHSGSIDSMHITYG
jgi:hypothetical protein